MSQVLSKFLTIAGISIACYLPAFGLIVFNNQLSNPSVKGQQYSSLSEDDKKKMGDIIQFEAAKIKSDLFNQISFPVVFSIVSIFAAFAVKDILQALLKANEKQEITEDLEKALVSKILPDAMKKYKSNVVSDLRGLESYIAYLEYETLRTSFNQILDKIPEMPSRSDEIKEKLMEYMQDIAKRKNYKLQQISSYIGEVKFQELVKIDLAYTDFSIKQLESSSDTVKSSLEEKISKQSKTLLELKKPIRFIPEDISSRSSELFQTQLNLLVTTLMISSEDEGIILDILDTIRKNVATDAVEIEQRGKRDDDTGISW